MTDHKHRDAVDRAHMARIAGEREAAETLAYLANRERAEREAQETTAAHLAKVAAVVSPVTIPRVKPTLVERYLTAKQARISTSACHTPHGSSGTRGSGK
jgi:hypothetical protein